MLLIRLCNLIQATSMEAPPSAVAQNDGLIFGLGSEGAWDEAVIGSPVVCHTVIPIMHMLKIPLPTRDLIFFRFCWSILKEHFRVVMRLHCPACCLHDATADMALN